MNNSRKCKRGKSLFFTPVFHSWPKIIFHQKSVPVTFYNTQRTTIMPKIRKIQWANSLESFKHTHGRTDKGQPMGPYAQGRWVQKWNIYDFDWADLCAIFHQTPVWTESVSRNSCSLSVRTNIWQRCGTARWYSGSQLHGARILWRRWSFLKLRTCEEGFVLDYIDCFLSEEVKLKRFWKN